MFFRYVKVNDPVVSLILMDMFMFVCMFIL